MKTNALFLPVALLLTLVACVVADLDDCVLNVDDASLQFPKCAPIPPEVEGDDTLQEVYYGLSDNGTITIGVKVANEGYFAFGFGFGMVGYQAVIGFPTADGEAFVADYSMEGYSSEEVQVGDEQGIEVLASEWDASSGMLSFVYRRQTEIEGLPGAKVGRNVYMWSRGAGIPESPETLKYHTARGVGKLLLEEGDVVAQVTATPTPSPSPTPASEPSCDDEELRASKVGMAECEEDPSSGTVTFENQLDGEPLKVFYVTKKGFLTNEPVTVAPGESYDMASCDGQVYVVQDECENCYGVFQLSGSDKTIPFSDQLFSCRSEIAPSDASDEGSECFPASATVETHNGNAVAIKDLSVGDHILTGEGDESGEVYFFSHKARMPVHSFIELAAGNSSIRISPGHLIYTSVGLKPASKVQRGDELMHATNGLVKVDGSRRVRDIGLYAPHTLSASGTLRIDGFLVSEYTTAVHPTIARLLLAPVRASYVAGFGKYLRHGLVWGHSLARFLPSAGDSFS
mmetsp:Transcript_23749/g.57965  ORF Transcript_23749/g.57965 Transcript_23749/m.57965 type:complete len:515 (-) Transcript_23749:147-1691(-)